MYEEEGQQQGDGRDNEICRLAPSPELNRDWLRKHSHLTRREALEKLRVSVSTFKRVCREYGISRWPSRERKPNGCSVVEQRLLNNSDHQNSPGSEPLEVVQPPQDIDVGAVFDDELDREGYPLEGRCVEVDNLMDDNTGQKTERAETSCITISHLKKKNITPTPKRKYKTKRSVTLDDLQPLFGLLRADAAETLGVSVATFKRYCRQNGITWWNGDGCSPVEPKLLNNSVHQNSPGSKPPEVEGEKETSALLIGKQDLVTVKAKYGERTLKFQLPLESGVAELNEAVAKRVELELGNFIVEYEDEDQERVWIACDEDLQECVKFSSSLGNRVIRLLVTDKVSNSEESRKSCNILKRKRS